MEKTVENIGDALTNHGVDEFACELGSSSADYKVRWWAGIKPCSGHESRYAIIRAIKRALDDAEMEIPFPYITHTIKEAVRLSDMN